MYSDSILSIENLNHHLGSRSLRKQVLFDINLKIRPREIVILTGPSGSGKTTLLTLIGGLRSIQSGSLNFLGLELRGASQSQLVQVRQHIGYIFQAHNLLSFLTARQNVQMAAEARRDFSKREARSRSEAMLQAVKLGDQLNKYPQTLSGGQKQRVAIARALVNHPKLILADEPTAALDSKTGRDVVDLMYRLTREQGCALLMVTHDNRILDIADRIIHLEDGQLMTKALT
ncbi:DevA family ABC transporter ATP-binding protein [Phormidesmis sp. 146-12]